MRAERSSPAHQLHHQRARAAAVLDAVNLGDVRMIERRECLRLAFEAHQAVGVGGERLGQDLERDVASEFRVARSIHLAHATGAKRAEDLVLIDASAGGNGHECVGGNYMPLIRASRTIVAARRRRRLAPGWSVHVESVTGNHAIRRDRSKFPAIVLFPRAAPRRSWIDRDMQDLVMLQPEKTIEEFHGDRSRVYLTGFSIGGAGTYRMAHRWPNRFAALLVVAGPVESGVGTPAGSDTGARDREVNPYTTATDPFAALGAGLRAMPIWIFHGDADQTVPVEQSRRLAAALKKDNARVEYTEYPGVSHGDAAVKAQRRRVNSVAAGAASVSSVPRAIARHLGEAMVRNYHPCLRNNPLPVSPE